MTEKMKEFIKRVLYKLDNNQPLTVAEQLIFNNPVQIRVKLAEQSLFLSELADDWSDEVRIKVANNPNTPPEILKKLANDKDWYVRAAVARNPNTPK
ncbi:MAG: hypothetical protein ACP5LE_02750 [Thermoplasmata archaeon]